MGWLQMWCHRLVDDGRWIFDLWKIGFSVLPTVLKCAPQARKFAYLGLEKKSGIAANALWQKGK